MTITTRQRRSRRASPLHKRARPSALCGPANQTFGASALTLGATASSGLTVSYTSTPTTVCTVSGSSLTMVSPGTCSITASHQSGQWQLSQRNGRHPELCDRAGQPDHHLCGALQPDLFNNPGDAGRVRILRFDGELHRNPEHSLHGCRVEPDDGGAGDLFCHGQPDRQ